MQTGDVEQLEYDTVVPGLQPTAMAQIRELLADRSLRADPGVEVFVVARSHDRVVACAGLDDGIVKCVALHPDLQGTGTLERLMTEVTYAAEERGRHHLFVYTKPAYEVAFHGAGFHTIVATPDVVLLENTFFGITDWTAKLRARRVEAERVGCVVVNCNPFTYGHRHLIEAAAAQCDVVHVLVVAEDASFFPYADRFALVQAGVADLEAHERIHVHPGSRYLVSKATFPTYFLKDQGVIDRAATAVDLGIFRQYVAPALAVTHRYVGTEPFCAVTRDYNAAMHAWLEEAPMDAPPVRVVEVPRVQASGRAISATEVRDHIAAGDLAPLAELVPPTTYAFIVDRFGGRLGLDNPLAATASAADQHR